MPLPQNLKQVLTVCSSTISRRHQLSQYLIEELLKKKDFPQNIDVPANWNVSDLEAVKPIFEKIGFIVEIRFVSNGGPYLRFYEAG